MFAMSTAMEAKRVLWNVVEEHFDEARFMFKAWTRALESPALTLNVIARKQEERLFAHLDGLVVGGEPVARRILEPELVRTSSRDPDGGLVAACGLLGQGQEEVVRAALLDAEPAVRGAAQRAFMLFGSPAFDRWVERQLSAATEPVRRGALLQVAAGRGLRLTGARLSVDTADPGLLAASLVVARRSSSDLTPREVEAMAGAADASVRDAALVTGLVLRSQAVLRRCLELAADERTAHPLPLLLVAMFGDARHDELLLRQLGRPTHCAAVLRALGFSGRVALVGSLLPYLAASEARVARLAGEAVSNLTGLDISVGPYRAPPPLEVDSLPALEADDLEADLVPAIEDDLPIPNAPAVADFWRVRGRDFERGTRLLWGRPWTVPRAVEVLSESPMRQRHPIALWLEVQSAGHAWVSTRALSRTQRNQIAAIRTVDGAVRTA
jgi:uncharacterized protein (TIGR02270 family)